MKATKKNSTLNKKDCLETINELIEKGTETDSLYERVGLACMNTSCKLIGIELNKKYFNACCKRLKSLSNN